MKTCNFCGEEKPIEAFPIVTDKRSKTGATYARSTCKSCVNRRIRAKRAGEDVSGRRPCDTCYRFEQCKTENYECSAFLEWVDFGQFKPAFMGMKEARE